MARKIQKELRAHRYGYVKLAVRAYMHLLEALKNDDSSLFAKELVVQPVVRPSTDTACATLNPASRSNCQTIQKLVLCRTSTLMLSPTRSGAMLTVS